jgi:anion-transporting  ArsA/GET3 family ATPase
MSLEETIRLTKTLARLKVPVSSILINNVVPVAAAEACDFCATRRAAQSEIIKAFRTRLKTIRNLWIAPQQPSEIRRTQSLREHFASWRAA